MRHKPNTTLAGNSFRGSGRRQWSAVPVAVVALSRRNSLANAVLIIIIMRPVVTYALLTSSQLGVSSVSFSWSKPCAGHRDDKNNQRYLYLDLYLECLDLSLGPYLSQSVPIYRYLFYTCIELSMGIRIYIYTCEYTRLHFDICIQSKKHTHAAHTHIHAYLRTCKHYNTIH